MRAARRYLSRLQSISLGQGQGPVAEKVLPRPGPCMAEDGLGWVEGICVWGWEGAELMVFYCMRFRLNFILQM
jgi:hypothetical protein